MRRRLERSLRLSRPLEGVTPQRAGWMLLLAILALLTTTCLITLAAIAWCGKKVEGRAGMSLTLGRGHGRLPS